MSHQLNFDNSNVSHDEKYPIDKKLGVRKKYFELTSLYMKHMPCNEKEMFDGKKPVLKVISPAFVDAKEIDKILKKQIKDQSTGRANSPTKTTSRKSSKKIDEKSQKSFNCNKIFTRIRQNNDASEKDMENSYKSGNNYKKASISRSKKLFDMHKKHLSMTMDQPEQKQSFFIPENDHNEIESGTNIEKSNIIKELDKWEYKNIIEKKFQKNIYTSNKTNKDVKKSSGRSFSNNELESGINIEILDGAMQNRRKEIENLKSNPQKMLNKSSMDKLLTRAKKEDDLNLNEEFMKRKLNKEIINEIYYKKSWNSFIKSKSPEQLMEAKQNSLNSYYRSNSPVTNDRDKKKLNNTISYKNDEIEGGGGVIDDKILEQKRKDIQSQIMISYKNLQTHFPHSKIPLSEADVKQRMFLTLTNYNQPKNEFKCARDVENMMNKLISEIDLQTDILENLKKDRNGLTKKQCDLTKQKMSLDNELISCEHEKNCKVFNANSNINSVIDNKKSKFTNSMQRIPYSNKERDFRKSTNNLLNISIASLREFKKDQYSQISIKDDNQHMNRSQQNYASFRSNKLNVVPDYLAFPNGDNSKKSIISTNLVNDDVVEIHTKFYTEINNMNKIEKNINDIEKKVDKINEEFEKNSQLKNHKIDLISDLIYKTINNNTVYVKENGIMNILVKLQKISGGINKDRISNNISDEGKRFIMKLAAIENKQDTLKDEREKREEASLKTAVPKTKFSSHNISVSHENNHKKSSSNDINNQEYNFPNAQRVNSITINENSVNSNFGKAKKISTVLHENCKIL